MDGNPKPSADFRWPHLTGSSAANVPSAKLYPFVYSSTYTLNNIDASYCGRILQTNLKNGTGSSLVTASTNVTVLCKSSLTVVFEYLLDIVLHSRYTQLESIAIYIDRSATEIHERSSN